MWHIWIYDMIKNVISHKKRSHEVFVAFFASNKRLENDIMNIFLSDNKIIQEIKMILCHT